MTDPRVEPAAIALYVAVQPNHRTPEGWNAVKPIWRKHYESSAVAVIAALDKAATLSPVVSDFINERPEYVEALKSTRGTDDQSDYHRWQGHAEARRQLAQAFGLTVPHEFGDKATRVVE